MLEGFLKYLMFPSGLFLFNSGLSAGGLHFRVIRWQMVFSCTIGHIQKTGNVVQRPTLEMGH